MMKEFLNSKHFKVAMMVCAVSAFMCLSAFAEEPVTIDVSAINTAFITGFQSMVTNSIAMISAMVPIGLTLAGVVFLVRKAMSWFKGMAK